MMQRGVKSLAALCSGEKISPLHFAAGSQISSLYDAAGSQVNDVAEIFPLHDAAGSQIFYCILQRGVKSLR
jgi:hypothetical protein